MRHIFRRCLKMQGHFEEIALELVSRNQQKIPVLLNAFERKDEAGNPMFIRFMVVKASDRRTYEDNLKQTKANLEISLANALQVATLRDQFIAILGHDLRNPLGSIIAATSFLGHAQLDPQQQKVLQIIHKSAGRMNELIGNIMDFARTRLGEGMVINRQPTVLKPLLQQVVDELGTIHPTRVIKTDYDLVEPVACDGPRIAQLLSNLLANAITHGAPGGPVSLKVKNKKGIFELSVSNAGHKIAADQLVKLFEPFTRESRRPSQNGLGLGLYIASQIAKSHKGELTATSTDAETCFVFRFPENGNGR
jgi:sigma-B regulation protein RsbU (phosphoserine phosphatase)